MAVPALEIRRLTRAYRLGDAILAVLADVSFTAGIGESVAVVGPSGSGKSTLLGLIAGLDVPDHGQVLVEGRDLAAMPERDRAAWRNRRLGVLFQSYRLLPTLSARENIRLPLELSGIARHAADLRVDDLLARVGLTARADHLPAQLSGGEQQRVALARALANRPALVVADEPTGNLDSVNGAHVAELLFATVRDDRTTLVLVTHDAALAAQADRRINLRDGRVVASGA
ncbi:ABC transporter ATP-binding protein [Planctomycetota bacterium]|nr:ABC transporter ATP-binding protein [Planctomycetota bacterium]